MIAPTPLIFQIIGIAYWRKPNMVMKMQTIRRAPRSELPPHIKARFAVAAQIAPHPRSRVRERINAFGKHYGYSPPEALHQREALKAAGCATIGDNLNAVIEKLRTGDVLVVARLRMLASSIGDLRDIVQKVTDKGATIMATETPFNAGGEFRTLLDIFAEFEPTSPVKPAKSVTGRPRSVDESKVLAFKEQGHKVAAIAQHLGISKSAVYACLAKAK